MGDELSFVQFPHPGGEHGPDAADGTLKQWGRGDDDHARKFMVSAGAWREQLEGSTNEGELFFWGEWEAASTVIPAPERVPDGPSWLHRPFFEGLQDAPIGAIRQNTDPFVFGEQFLYTYCRQPRNRRLRHLASGSVILFGSRKRGQFVLDTVFVVDRSIPHTPATYANVAVPPTNPVFRATTLDPMYEQVNKGCRLYFGATVDDPVNGMFSFVPCRPARERRTFARPVIELPDPFIKPGLARQAGTTRLNDPEMSSDLWRQVVDQVLKECALGVHVELPGGRA